MKEDKYGLLTKIEVNKEKIIATQEFNILERLEFCSLKGSFPPYVYGGKKKKLPLLSSPSSSYIHYASRAT
jgi:hypothetical protein